MLWAAHGFGGFQCYLTPQGIWPSPCSWELGPLWVWAASCICGGSRVPAAGSGCSSTEYLSFFRRDIHQAGHATCSTAHPTVPLIGLLVQKEQSRVLRWERLSIDQSSLILQHFVPFPQTVKTIQLFQIKKPT